MKDVNSRRSFINKLLIGTAGMMTLPDLVFGSKPKRVALIGDTIRLEYQPYVDLTLQGRAVVWGPDEDCKDTVNILSNAYKWFAENTFDIIHINAGLYDSRTIPKSSNKNLIPVNQFEENVERIIKYIYQVQPNAIIIWATTTPLIEERITGIESYGISNENIVKYNEAALKVVNQLGVPVNDLYTYILNGDIDLIITDDGIHFKDIGYHFITEQVAGAIGLFLDK